MRPFHLFTCALVCGFITVPKASTQAAPMGIFESHSEIGAPLRHGSVDYNPEHGAYTVTGGGENMWFTNDAFHFVWKKVSGDVTLAADIAFPEPGGNAHRKACILVRQSLEPDS